MMMRAADWTPVLWHCYHPASFFRFATPCVFCCNQQCVVLGVL